MNLAYRKPAARPWFAMLVSGGGIFLAVAAPAVAAERPGILRFFGSDRDTASMAAVIPDGRHILTTGIGGPVYNRDRPEGQEPFLIPFRRSRPAGLSLLPTDRLTAFSRNESQIWSGNPASEYLLGLFLQPTERQPPLFGVRFASDRGYAVSAGAPRFAQDQDDLFSAAESQRFVQDVTGDFAVRVFVRRSAFPAPDSRAVDRAPHRFVREGVLVWQDDWNFLRYERVASTGEGRNAVYLWGMYFSDGSETAVVHFDIPDENVFLRVELNNGVCTLALSRDGETWIDVRPTHWRVAQEWSTVRPDGASITFEDAVKVGVYAINGTDRWRVLEFRDFPLDRRPPRQTEATAVPAGRPAQAVNSLAVQAPISLSNDDRETEAFRSRGGLEQIRRDRSVGRLPIEESAAQDIRLTGWFAADRNGAEPAPGRVPDFVDLPWYRKVNEDSVYGDVLSHSRRRPFSDALGRATSVHETTHGINSFLRKKYAWRAASGRVNGFYVLHGRGVILLEPNLQKNAVADFVPQILRFDGYETYMADEAWEDFPLYLFDEWVAYVNDAMANVEDVHSGRYEGGWTNGVSGCLEFSIYAVALGMAVAEHDPAYWQNYPQFRTFLIWHLRRAQQAYVAGHRLKQFAWHRQDRLLNNFLTSPEAEPMRQFIRTSLEGAWLDTPQLLPEP